MVHRLFKSIIKARGTYVLLLFLFVSIFIASAYRASDVLFTAGKDRLVATSNDGFVAVIGKINTTSFDTVPGERNTEAPLNGLDEELGVDPDIKIETKTEDVEEEKKVSADSKNVLTNEEEYFVDESKEATKDILVNSEDTLQEDDKFPEDVDRSLNNDEIILTEVATETISRLEVEEDELTTKEQFRYEKDVRQTDEDLDELENEISVVLDDLNEEDLEALLEKESEAVWLVEESEANPQPSNSTFDDLASFERFDEVKIKRLDNDFDFTYEEDNEDFRIAIEILRDEILEETYLFEKKFDEFLDEDSDGDGVTDYDEIAIYKTNPFSENTIEDGLSDGDKILRGINPLTNKPIIFEDPRTVFEPSVGEYSIEELNIKTSTSTDGVSTKLEFKGRGLPNSFVTLYIFSTPVVVTIKTDGEGLWSYELDKELDNGKHEIYVATVDNSGKIVAKSEGIPFVKTANAAELGVGIATSDKSTGFFRSNFVLIIILISIVGVFVMIIFVSNDLRRARKHRKELESTTT